MAVEYGGGILLDSGFVIPLTVVPTPLLKVLLRCILGSSYGLSWKPRSHTNDSKWR